LTGHPEKQIDYATRSTNLMTVRSKQIIEAFYGEPPKYSYFFGCSTGGGQALHEALQFPRRLRRQGSPPTPPSLRKG
jgi:feruloyl esterase